MTGYQITPTAERDIRAILQYIADQDGIERARHVHAKFVEAFELLGSMPGAGRVREELTGANVRWWTVFKFVVIYQVDCSPIAVLRVLHGMRDLEAIL